MTIEELLNYGINTDLAPVLDVNNNPLNPVIGARSYYDNPLMVALYGKYMLEGMKSNNLMACPKHFPGHGNTTTDSHYGLPSINNLALSSTTHPILQLGKVFFIA